ncbi:GHMP family kinase ATP-binding protein [Streptomyces tendae]|uniref:GHMP family kinase ATP-binding protein n=1 Tax=Streptomyces tendae TaxID=1932 RepID=UPI003657F4F0
MALANASIGLEGDRTHVVTARAPLRVSLAGGGTDLPSYAARFGGAVVGLAIDRHVSVSVYPRAFDGTLHASWGATAAQGAGNPFAHAALRSVGIARNVQLASFADAPSGAGLGGSGAFTVALLHALLYQRDPDRKELAERASAIEMRDLDRPVGKHDHYMAAFGGLRALWIGQDQTVRPERLVPHSRFVDYVKERLLLFYTGSTHDAGRVLSDQARLTQREDESTVSALRAIHSIVPDMHTAVTTGRVDDIGPMLDAHWKAKRRLSRGVSSTRIDRLYNASREAGADGAKLLGAGGGGFLLVSSALNRADDIRRAMAEIGAQELPFDLAAGGSRAAGVPL